MKLFQFILVIILLFQALWVKSQGIANEDWNDLITLKNQTSINTEMSEFSPIYWNDFIVFVGANKREKLFDKKTKEPYFDLFLSAPNTKNELVKRAEFSKNINSNFHEGPACFSDNGKHIFYTKIHSENNILIENQDGVVLNKIYESRFAEGQWAEAELSEINIEDYASCHPALNSKNDLLIFSSDRPGGYGKMDLYFSHFRNGSWTEPENLGPEINTEENELFPVIHRNDYLIFSSDGVSKNHDLQLIKVQLNSIFEIPKPLILPHPINSDYDDFGLVLDEIGLTGYLTSNRPGGQGKDDILLLESSKSILSFGEEDYNKVRITVNGPEQEVLYNTQVYVMPLSQEAMLEFDNSLFDINKEKSASFQIDEEGRGVLSLSDGFNLIFIESDGYKNWSKIVSTSNRIENLTAELHRTKNIQKDTIIKYVDRPIVKKINNVEVKKGATLIFNNIYYDYNSDQIKSGAAQELDALAKIMLDRPELKIELSAHTDSRGEANYNQKLSEKRALSAKNYLIQKGVFQNNILTKGYGEQQLRNHCRDGVYCTEAEHIYNRRTEVKILKF